MSDLAIHPLKRTPGEEGSSPSQRAWRRFLRNGPAVCSLVFLAVLSALLLAWPWLAPHRWDTISDQQYQPPSAEHWFGTDIHGRDVLTRVMYGGRISMLAGLVGSGVALVIGVAWGAVAGYVGGKWDAWLMRVVDVLYSLPSIIFVIVLITTLNEWVRGQLASLFRLNGTAAADASSLLFLFAGLGAVSWLTMARIVRGQVLSLRQRSFVEASRALGASHLRILIRHVLPNTTGVVITYLTLTVPAIILYESFLSYLGLGIQPPMASWGSLIAEGAQQLNLVRIYWWLIVCPAGMLVTALLSLNFLGDGLRDAFDPGKGG